MKIVDLNETCIELSSEELNRISGGITLSTWRFYGYEANDGGGGGYSGSTSGKTPTGGIRGLTNPYYASTTPFYL